MNINFPKILFSKGYWLGNLLDLNEEANYVRLKVWSSNNRRYIDNLYTAFDL